MASYRRALARAVLMALSAAGAAASSVAAQPAASADAGLRLVVNLPAYRLDVHRDGVLDRSYPVTIGKRGYETPTGVFEVGHVIWNPWWHPPQSDWARDRQPERPGPNNPMGRAKLHFAELLYIHGTPNLAALGGSGSHGCIRLSNADVLELSRLVQEYAAPDAAALVDPLVRDPRRTQRMDLERGVRLEIVYDLAEVRDGQLELHPDPYGLSRRSAVRAELVHALLRAGIDLVHVDSDRLDQLAASQPRGTRRVALSEMIVPGPLALAPLAAGAR